MKKIKKTTAHFDRGAPPGGWYFAFHLNESHYRQVQFTKHKTVVAAEKRHYVPFVNYETPAHLDFTTTIVQGVKALQAWALDCDYRIDWDQMLLIYEEEK